MKSGTSTVPSTRAAVDSWPGQAAVGRALGLSRTQVRRLVDQGVLAASKGSDGSWRFNPVDLEAEAERRRATGGGASAAVAPEADGNLAARAFALFAAHGIDIRRAVMDIKLTPGAAEQLAGDYARLGGEVVLSSEGLATLRARLGAPAELRSGADVLDAATQRAIRAAADLTKQLAERDGAWQAKVAALEAALAECRQRLAQASPGQPPSVPATASAPAGAVIPAGPPSTDTTASDDADATPTSVSPHR